MAKTSSKLLATLRQRLASVCTVPSASTLHSVTISAKFLLFPRLVLPTSLRSRTTLVPIARAVSPTAPASHGGRRLARIDRVLTKGLRRKEIPAGLAYQTIPRWRG